MKLLELYTSVQGEGPNVGVPTTFVRFAGCNLRCPGWPCDTPYSIYPELWSKEFEKVSPDELIAQVMTKYPHHVCITGGEPFLQQEEELNELFNRLINYQMTMDIFTNGTIPFKAEAARRSRITIVMDWKLSGSGEGNSFIENREFNRHHLRPQDAIKFVVAHEDDLEEMENLLRGWGANWYNVYVSPAWGMIEPAKVVEFLEMRSLHNVKLNVQIHKYIWEPTARRI